MYVSTASNLPNVMEGFLETNCDSKSCGHCLTLVVDRNDSANQLIALGQVVQMKRPVAILFTGVEDSHSLVENFISVDSSFPILIMPEDQRGKRSGKLAAVLDAWLYLCFRGYNVVLSDHQ